MKDQKAEHFEAQWGLDRKFRNPNEKAKQIPVFWAE